MYYLFKEENNKLRLLSENYKNFHKKNTYLDTYLLNNLNLYKL